MTMIQQLTYLASKKVEWQGVLTPRLTTDKSALVKPMAVARCDLDRFVVAGQYRTRGPFALGHEIAGLVIDVGDEVTSFVPGDRVIVPFQINCGECVNCLRGWTNACSSVPFSASYGLGGNDEKDYGGGFSDLIEVPFGEAMLVKIPTALSFSSACGLSDNVADGYRTVAPYLALFPKAPVLIVGGLAQSVGLYAVQAAITCGSEKVVYADHDDNKLAIAKRLGAKIFKLSLDNNLRVERYPDEEFLITVDAACTSEALSFAIHSTMACGFCTSVSGGLSEKTELPLSTAYLKGIRYDVSRVHGRSTLPDVLHKVCCESLDPLLIVKDSLTFDDLYKNPVELLLNPSPKIIFKRENSND
ncbi:MAG: alcohol dehydrogenase catalytic domain-containing protein [Cellvibrionaceae bacterium]